MKHLTLVILLSLSMNCLAKDFGLTDVPAVIMQAQEVGTCDIQSHVDANGNAC